MLESYSRPEKYVKRRSILLTCTAGLGGVGHQLSVHLYPDPGTERLQASRRCHSTMECLELPQFSGQLVFRHAEC